MGVVSRMVLEAMLSALQPIDVTMATATKISLAFSAPLALALIEQL